MDRSVIVKLGPGISLVGRDNESIALRAVAKLTKAPAIAVLAAAAAWFFHWRKRLTLPPRQIVLISTDDRSFTVELAAAEKWPGVLELEATSDIMRCVVHYVNMMCGQEPVPNDVYRNFLDAYFPNTLKNTMLLLKAAKGCGIPQLVELATNNLLQNLDGPYAAEIDTIN